MRVVARAVFERNHEESGWDTFLQFQVTIIEIPPEVFRKTEVNKWELQGRRPVLQQTSNRAFVRECRSRKEPKTARYKKPSVVWSHLCWRIEG